MQDIKMITSGITLVLSHQQNYLSEYGPPILKQRKKKHSKREYDYDLKDDYLHFLPESQTRFQL